MRRDETATPQEPGVGSSMLASNLGSSALQAGLVLGIRSGARKDLPQAAARSGAEV